MREAGRVTALRLLVSLMFGILFALGGIIALWALTMLGVVFGNVSREHVLAAAPWALALFSALCIVGTARTFGRLRPDL